MSLARPTSHTRIAALLFCLALSHPAFTQAPSSEPAPANPLASAIPPATLPSPTQVTGSVLDDQGSAVSGATITLHPFGKAGERTAASATDGTYTFTALSPGQYRLEVTAPGFSLYTSGEIVVRSGATITLPNIALKVSTSTNLTVTASQEQIAVAEVHEQEQQRVFGVFQNFYTSYIWDAAPMPVSQKYKLAFRSLIDVPQFLIVAGVAGAEHYNGTYPGYGPGIQGYGKRYGAALADATTSRIVGSAILPSLLHQDPRYFYQGSGSVPSRALHAVAFTFTARGDNGKTQLNYSHLLGSLAAAGLANTYHPASSRGLGDTFQTFGISLTTNIVGNLFREFVLRHLETIPTFANGKH